MSKHEIVHIEIPSKSLESDGQFYQEVFGWEVQHMPEMDYTTLSFNGRDSKAENEASGGGLVPVSDEYPAGRVLVYISTDDIDATLQQIEECGGKTVLPRTEIPGMGWFAHFTDRTGNRIGLYEGMKQA